MHSTELEEIDFYRALQDSGAKVLLIGRMAMVLRGLPVSTNDYDLWVDADDIEALNGAMAALDHVPNHPPDVARARGRYVLENGEHIDVMVARAGSTRDGATIGFADVWNRRELIELTADVRIAIPSIVDHIATKKWSMRAKDIADIQLLEALLRERGA